MVVPGEVQRFVEHFAGDVMSTVGARSNGSDRGEGDCHGHDESAGIVCVLAKQVNSGRSHELGIGEVRIGVVNHRVFLAGGEYCCLNAYRIIKLCKRLQD